MILSRRNPVATSVALLFAAGISQADAQAATQAGTQADAPPVAEVVSHYADMAQAGYTDALAAARDLDTAIDAMLDSPSDATLADARKAWFAARVPYQQTEAFRFGNPIVDEWEGRVNSWPLDEGLIDYVDASYGSESDENEFYTANIVASESLAVNGETIDAKEITPELLESLQEAGGIESNVATGYHAIEFLLWGQDLHGSDAGAGERPATDYATGDDCSNGHCDRRGQYLSAASELLISDLGEMASNWQPGGAARAALDDAGENGALTAMLTGMGSLSYGELAGERMQLGLMLHDPEEEHDCFSDNTAMSHYLDGLGIRNVWQGSYEHADGSKVEGASLQALVAAQDPELAEELSGELDASVDALHEMVKSQDAGRAYDQLIAEGDAEGNALVQTAIDALIAQTRNMERVIATLDLQGIELEGSDSLDDPNAVFQ